MNIWRWLSLQLLMLGAGDPIHIELWPASLNLSELANSVPADFTENTWQGTAKSCLECAQQRQKTYADRGHWDASYE